MSLISSCVLCSLPQADGTFNVREQLIDDQGNIYNFDYEATANIDQNAHLVETALAWEAINGSSS